MPGPIACIAASLGESRRAAGAMSGRLPASAVHPFSLAGYLDDLEAPRRIRVNVVSPGWVTETMKALGMDTAGGLPAATVAETYVQAVEGSMTGQVLGTAAR